MPKMRRMERIGGAQKAIVQRLRLWIAEQNADQRRRINDNRRLTRSSRMMLIDVEVAHVLRRLAMRSTADALAKP